MRSVYSLLLFSAMIYARPGFNEHRTQQDTVSDQEIRVTKSGGLASGPQDTITGPQTMRNKPVAGDRSVMNEYSGSDVGLGSNFVNQNDIEDNITSTRQSSMTVDGKEDLDMMDKSRGGDGTGSEMVDPYSPSSIDPFRLSSTRSRMDSGDDIFGQDTNGSDPETAYIAKSNAGGVDDSFDPPAASPPLSPNSLGRLNHPNGPLLVNIPKYKDGFPSQTKKSQPELPPLYGTEIGLPFPFKTGGSQTGLPLPDGTEMDLEAFESQLEGSQTEYPQPDRTEVDLESFQSQSEGSQTGLPLPGEKAFQSRRKGGSKPRLQIEAEKWSETDKEETISEIEAANSGVNNLNKPPPPFGFQEVAESEFTKEVTSNNRPASTQSLFPQGNRV